MLPLMNRFPNKPLIYNVLWKTTVYFVATYFVRYLELFVPLVFEHGDTPALTGSGCAEHSSDNTPSVPSASGRAG